MSPLVKNIIRFVLFIVIQVFILNEIPPLHRFIVPYIYFLYIVWLPFKMTRIGLMVLAFFFGLFYDLFIGTTGLHAAACVLLAYSRPYVLAILIPHESTEQSYIEPSITSMGWAPYAVYVSILTFIHHFYLVLLEWLQFGSFGYFLGKVISTTGISILLIFVAEMLVSRKGRYRMNS